MKILIIQDARIESNRYGLTVEESELRAGQLTDIFVKASAEVICALPLECKSVRPELKYFWNSHNQAELIAEVSPDIVVFSPSWRHFNLPPTCDVPIILDLVNPAISPEKSYVSGRSRKLEALVRASLVISPSHAQHNYFSGWLVQAGKIPDKENKLVTLPLSFNAQNTTRVEKNKSNSCIIFSNNNANDSQLVRRCKELGYQPTLISEYVGANVFEELVADKQPVFALWQPEDHYDVVLSEDYNLLLCRASNIPLFLPNDIFQSIEHLFDVFGGFVSSSDLNSDRLQLKEELRNLFAGPLQLGKDDEALLVSGERELIEVISNWRTNLVSDVQVHPSLGTHGALRRCWMHGRRSKVLVKNNFQQSVILPEENVATVILPDFEVIGAEGEVKLELRSTGIGKSLLAKKSIKVSSSEIVPEVSLSISKLSRKVGGTELCLHFYLKGSIEVNLQAAECEYPFRSSVGLPEDTAVMLRFVPGITSTLADGSSAVSRVLLLIKRREWRRLFAGIKSQIIRRATSLGLCKGSI